MLKVQNASGVTLAYLNNALTGKVREVLNGAYVIAFTVTVDPLKTEYLYDKNNIINYNDDWFRVVQIEDVHSDDNSVIVNVKCEHISYDLLKNNFDVFTFKEITGRDVMLQCLLGTDFSLRRCDILEKQSIEITQECNSKQVSIGIAAVWQGELKYYQKYIDFVKSRGTNRGTGFIFGKNLNSVKRIKNMTDDTISYEVSVIESPALEELGYYELGDTVRIMDERLNIDISMKIIELEKDILTGINNTVVLGETIKDMRNSFSSMKNKVETINTIINESSPDWDKIKKITDEYGNIILGKLDSITNVASKIVNSTGTFEHRDNALYWQDQPTKENSTFATLWGAQGLIFANSKDINGDWIWQTALDSDGLIANKVTANAINGMLIEAVNIFGSTITGGEIIGSTIKGSTVMAGEIEMTGAITWNTDSSPVKAQYSVDGTSNWHSEMTSLDVYARYSYDGGRTWTDAMKMFGEDGPPGEPGVNYRVEVISSNGSIFKNGDVNTTLRAIVYKNDENITDSINASKFRWIKINSDGTPDVEWNTEHAGGVKMVAITAEDVRNRATFLCEVDI